MKQDERKYKVPENYFTDLNSSILEKTTRKTKKNTNAWYAIAASLALLILGGVYFSSLNNTTSYASHQSTDESIIELLSMIDGVDTRDSVLYEIADYMVYLDEGDMTSEF